MATQKKISGLAVLSTAPATSAIVPIVQGGVTYSVTRALLTSVLGRFNVSDYGATGDGLTDDSAALQSAINAANLAGGGTVLLPTGTYLVNTALILKSNVKLEGSGSSTIIKTNSTNDMFTWSTAVSRVEIYNIALNATGGNIFAPTTASGKLSYSTIHHCWITQNTSSKSIWYQTTGNLISLLFSENYCYAAGATRSVAAWYHLDPLAACNSNWWQNNTFETAGSTGKPFFYIESQNAGDYSYDNHWLNCVFEVCDGGSIQLMSTFGAVIDGCYTYDNVDLTSPAFYIGKGASGLASTNTVIRNSGRIGSHLHAANSDLYLEATTRQTLIQGFRCSPDTGVISLNSAPNVTIIEASVLTTINNPSATTTKLTADGINYFGGLAEASGSGFQISDAGNLGLLVKATAVGSVNNGVVRIETNDVTKRFLDLRLTGDSVARFKFTLSGNNGMITLGDGVTADATLYRSAANTLKTDNILILGTVGTVTGSAVVIDGTQTLTNKRVTKRVVAVTQAATPAINTDTTDVASITALAQAITSMTTNLTGTPVDGDELTVRITDNGTNRAITWGASFEASTVALPTTTTTPNMLLVRFVWNAVSSKWRCILVA